MSAMIFFPAELEEPLGRAVALARMYCLEHQRLDELKAIDDAVRSYKSGKRDGDVAKPSVISGNALKAFWGGGR